MFMTRRIPDIAVIGAGVAGLSCADRLAENGLQVQVFDKGLQPGGRVATRYRLGLTFEHGAPGQRPLVEHLASRFPVVCESRVDRISRQPGGGWIVGFAGQPARGPFSGVVLALPAPQVRELLAPTSTLAERLAVVTMRPVLTALVALPGPLGRGWELIRFRDQSLELALRQAGRHVLGPEGWVLQASAEFSRDNLECDPQAVAQHLWHRFRNALDLTTATPLYLRGHRWRYGRTERPLGQPCLHDDALGLGICGDWCIDDGVDAAQASGRALAARILGIPERPEHRALATKEEQA